MTDNQFGVIIEKGPINWQILSQKDGKADINLSGHLAYTDPLNGSERILARVVDENTGILICEPAVTELLPEQRFELTIKNVPAGGLYRIETLMRLNGIAEKIGNRIHHVGIGDVFVIAGQSNAVGVGKDTAYDPVELGIHMYRKNGRWDIASHPLADSTGTIYPDIREGAQLGHSPWINFARTLKNRLHYPIGLIPAAKGGVPLSLWNPEEDGILYKNMLRMIEESGSVIKGVLWSQGCNDANDTLSETYLERFLAMVQHFRTDLHSPGLPFFTVQLNKVTCVKGRLSDTASAWGKIREAQRKAAITDEFIYIVPSIDQNVCDGIHNRASSNMVIGERVANQALKHLYKVETLCDAPMILSAMLTASDTVQAEFSNVIIRLNTDLIPTERFPLTVEDEEGKIPLSDYQAEGAKITLKLQRAVKGEKVFLHCAMEEFPFGVMPYDVDSYLPLVPFYRFEVGKAKG